MKKSTEARADEKLAIELLKESLGKDKDLEFRCERNMNDPPDIVVIWENGKRWGVEITQIRKSEDRFDQLERFGKELGKMTESVRKRGYSLGLGSDPIYLRGEMAPRYDKKWKEETQKAIWQHIRSDKIDTLKLPGVFLSLKNTLGKDWEVRVSAGVSDVSPCIIEEMLWHAFHKKTKGLSRWNGDFEQRWLLLLNCYPLASGFNDDMKDALHDFAEGIEDEFGRFDGVLWSGYDNRSLLSIYLSRSP